MPAETPFRHASTRPIESFHGDVVQRVADAIRAHDVVVVGMAWNPHVKRARKLLDEAGHTYEYLEFGNYLSGWKERLAIKMWTGWPTFPQVFVKGGLVGGADETGKALEEKQLEAMLAS